ncbi:MAG TPA: Gfo/Idh/MocA family oxidoreductase, partial [Candidatus Cloacimonas acidaminovorans]|nr:Gfo/Idh/MocA family oxidoreductase [Candidatus Cloacimonas acidaminovorans]
MKTVKIGLIGCGRISKNHLDAVSQIPEAEFVAVCDLVEEKMQAVAENYGIKNLYNNYQDMLENEKLDLVSICTPSGLHPQMGI